MIIDNASVKKFRKFKVIIPILIKSKSSKKYD